MKNIILIFGGGELQISIIVKAKALGFQTVVIDPNPNAYAKDIADCFYQVEGDDFKKTLAIARHYEIKGLVTAATDHPILMMCKIAAELHLPFPNYKSCDTLLDKGKFKLFLKSNNLAHAEGAVYRVGDVINESDFKYPLITKPLNNSGSRGVIRCDKKENLKEAINETLKYCINGRFIIEKYIDGDEISVEAIVHKNKVHIIQITDKMVTFPPYNVELGHLQPSKYHTRYDEIETLLQKIVDNLGINDCAIHPEIKINHNFITIIEIGPRLGGDYITSKLVPLSTGINMEELVIKMATSCRLEVKKFHKSSMIVYLSFPANMIVKHIVNETELVEKFPEVVEFRHSLKVGDSIQIITNSLNRYGYYILQANNVDDLKKSANKIGQYLINCFIEN